MAAPMIRLRTFVCCVAGLVGCTDHGGTTHVAVAAPAEVRAPEVVASTPVAAEAHCAGPQATGAESRALAEWLARNPVEEGFACPAALRVVQREEWWAPVTDLSIGDPDQIEGPTTRVNLGERIVYWGVDPASGDMLTVSIGRLDVAAFAAASEKYPYPDHDTYSTPMLEEDARLLGGAWRGLGFEARAGAPALALRQWLAALPPGRVHSAPIDWQAVDDRQDVNGLPRLTHVAGETSSTLCVTTAETTRCWSTSPTAIVEVAEDDEPGKFLVVMGARQVRSVWRLDSVAGTWELAGGKRGARRFRDVAAISPVPGALVGHWIESLTDETIAAGHYDYDSQGLTHSAAWIARRHAQGWRLGALDGDEMVARVEWSDPATFGLVLGYDDTSPGDGLGYKDGRFIAFTVDGEWLAPAGRLPLPVRGGAALRGEGGWGYAYALKAREPACLVVTRERSETWPADRARRRRLELPMPSLAGEWSFGREGLRRGC